MTIPKTGVCAFNLGQNPQRCFTSEEGRSFRLCAVNLLQPTGYVMHQPV